MTPVLKQVSDDALHLPAQDRAQLAHLLIVSIDDEDEADVSAAWDAELEKRVQEIREGKVKGVPAEEVFARLDAKHR